jgi:hypothetical protein
MRLEGDSNRSRVTLLRTLSDIAQHGLVCAMDTVEISHTDDGRSEIGRDVFEFVKNPHHN